MSKISINYKDIEINANLIYRKRKNITIQIKPNCEVTLISPPNVSKKILEDILLKKGDWILKKLDNYKELEHLYKEKEYIDDEKFMYLGKEYNLKVIKDEEEDIFIKDDKILVKVKEKDKEYIKNKFKVWYKEESEKLVSERLIQLKKDSDIMAKLMPNKLKVKGQKKRWGTCTSKGYIYINSKISMAKKEAIDYILVHEFSHLVHMNHSKDFYNLVQKIMPNYKKEEKWLRENSYKLTL